MRMNCKDTKPISMEINEIQKLIEAHKQLSAQAYNSFLPEVENLLASKTKDSNKIEYALDSMLEFCNNTDVLKLYKKLCRYYWDIDQQATETYINFYRNRWDEDSFDRKEEEK